jgi:dTDP-L-rhamnose 4-epimerase
MSVANDLGTAVLLEAALEADVRRIVVASSMSIYGEGLYRTPDGRLDRGRPARRPSDLQAGRWDPARPGRRDARRRCPRPRASGPTSPRSTR